jgi:hypothetical protein
MGLQVTKQFLIDDSLQVVDDPVKPVIICNDLMSQIDHMVTKRREKETVCTIAPNFNLYVDLDRNEFKITQDPIGNGESHCLPLVVEEIFDVRFDLGVCEIPMIPVYEFRDGRAVFIMEEDFVRIFHFIPREVMVKLVHVDSMLAKIHWWNLVHRTGVSEMRIFYPLKVEEEVGEGIRMTFNGMNNEGLVVKARRRQMGFQDYLYMTDEVLGADRETIVFEQIPPDPRADAIVSLEEGEYFTEDYSN